jgi:ABC-2 type transport system permease protein
MRGFFVLFNFGMKRRLKDSFIIGYSVIFPLMLIAALGYLSINLFNGEISSFQYYTLVLLPLCIFMGMITMAYIAREESSFKVSFRFIAAPIDKRAIVLSKIITATISMSLWNIIVIILVSFIFKVDFMGKVYQVILLVTSETFMVAALGVFIGVCVKNFMTIKNVLNLPICLFGFLGGAFFPIGALGKNFEVISYISPLTWINKGIISMIYDNNFVIFNISLLITLIIGIVFTLISMSFFKKEEFM